MSTKELNQKASEFDWNPNIEFRFWTRAAEAIHHEVRAVAVAFPQMKC